MLMPLVLVLAAGPDAVREALVRGDLPAALAAGEPWSKASPEAVPCYVALLEAAGRMKEAAALKKPAPPPAASAPASAPKLPGVAYVSASSLTLRAGPSPGAAVLARVPIGAKVEVLSQSGAYAKIRTAAAVRAPRVLELVPGDPTFRLPPPPAALEGFAAAEFLSAAAPSAAELKKAAESTDANASELALERLAALERKSELWARLAGAAFDLGKCGVAANAAQAVRAPAEVGGWVIEKADLFYRCRGDLSKAVLFEPSDDALKKRKVPPNACVALDPQEECGFCPLGFANPDGADAKREAARIERSQAATQKRVAAVGELFPKGPMLRVRLRRGGAPAERLALAEREVPPPACGDLQEPARTSSTPFELPVMNRDEQLELWLATGAYEAQAVTLAREADVKKALEEYEAATKQWRARPAGEAPALQLDGVTVSGPPPRSCCCD